MDLSKFLEGEKKYAAIGFAAVGLVAIIGGYLIYSHEQTKKVNVSSYQEQKNKNSGAGVDANSIFRFTTDTKRNEGLEDVKTEITELKSKIAEVLKENSSLKQQAKGPDTGVPITSSGPINTPQSTGQPPGTTTAMPPPIDYKAVDSQSDSDALGGGVNAPKKKAPIGGPGISFYSDKPAETPAKQKPLLVLPTLSVLKSYMLTGVIASPANTSLKTSASSMGGTSGMGGSVNSMGSGDTIAAKNFGTPFSARIKGDAILPNGFVVSELNDCFLLGGAKADMSQSRAMLIAHKITCIKPNGEIITSDINAFGQDEDGITGIAGKVVFKASSALARSFAAGLVGGLGAALAPQPVASYNSNASNGQSQTYQVPNAQYLFGSSLGNGASQASTLLAKYYLNFAEQMMPVIEVPNGTPVTWILTDDLVMAKKK